MNTTLFPAQGSNIYLIINNGARVLQNKYFDFASYLSKNQINVVTYDYRDMISTEKDFPEIQGSILQWAKRDMGNVMGHILEKDPAANIFILGHSLGGQIIGLSEWSTKAKGIVLVATQTGYYRYWKFPFNIINYSLWYFLIPHFVRVYGYFPGRKQKGTENMPKTPALEWAKWCQSPKYLFDHIPREDQYFEKITCPLLSISFDNDIYATRASVDWFTAKYSSAQVHKVHYKSKKIKYSHSALFEPKNFSQMGDDLIRFIENAL